MLRLSITLFALVSCAACGLDFIETDDSTRSGRRNSDDDDDDNDNDNDNGGGGGGGGGGGNTDTRQTCQQSSDCDNTVCYCVVNAGDFPSPVNTQHCVNGRCESPSQACPDSCSAFGKTWTGDYEIIANESGNSGGGNAGGGGGGSCPYENDGFCDEPNGTGECPAGTDAIDCARCSYENDQVCDDSTGTGLCPDGSDLFDCA